MKSERNGGDEIKKKRSLENLVRIRDVCKPYNYQVPFASIFRENLYETRTYECCRGVYRIYEFYNLLNKICSN